LALLYVASPCRSPRKGGQGSPSRGCARLSEGSSVVVEGSATFLSDMQHLASPRMDMQGDGYKGNAAGNLLQTPTLPQVGENDSDEQDDETPVARFGMVTPASRQSVGSVTSLRLMKSAIRPDRPEGLTTPGSQRDSREFCSMIFAASPCRRSSMMSSPSRSGSQSPPKGGHSLRRSDISDARASATFPSDIAALLSPRAPSPARNSPARLANALPPVDETAPANMDITPVLQKARESHPLLFSMMTPGYSPAVDTQETPQPASARTERNRMCGLELQLDQCEEELRQQRAALQKEQAALSQERLQREMAEEDLKQQREVAERLLREKEAENRQHEQRLLQWQRTLAVEANQQEQRSVESQTVRDAERRQAEQSLVESQAALDAEWVRFDMERELIDEDRRNFLLHHVHEADAELIRREKELRDKHERLDAENSNMEVEKKQLALEQAEHTRAELRLADSKRHLRSREAKVAARERLHSETTERASQTPVFRPCRVQRSLCYRLFSNATWSGMLMGLLLVVILLFDAALFARVSPWWPELWSDVQMQQGSLFAHQGWHQLWARMAAAQNEKGFSVSSFLQQRLNQYPARPSQHRKPTSMHAAKRGLNISDVALAELCSTAVPCTASEATGNHVEIPETQSWSTTIVGTVVPLAYWWVTP